MQFPTPVANGVNFFQSKLSFLDKFCSSSSNESIISVEFSTVLVLSCGGF